MQLACSDVNHARPHRRLPALAQGSVGGALLSAASSASTAATTSPDTLPPVDCRRVGRGKVHYSPASSVLETFHPATRSNTTGRRSTPSHPQLPVTATALTSMWW